MAKASHHRSLIALFVDYPTIEPPGTIIIDAPNTLYLTIGTARQFATASASAVRASLGRAPSALAARKNGRTGCRHRK